MKYTGKVVKVGKAGGKDQFRCWLKNTDDTTKDYDFSKDVDSWQLVKK